MALVKGRFVDKDIPIQSNNDPVDAKDLARKSYVDQKAAAEAAAAVAALDLSGKADLVDGKVPSSQLPSFVDDVLEFNDLASFPAEGEAGKIYVAKDSNKTYRWSGSVYVEISASPGSTDAVAEGSLNLYFTEQRAKDAVQADLDGKVSKSGDSMSGPLMVESEGFRTIVQSNAIIAAQLDQDGNPVASLVAGCNGLNLNDALGSTVIAPSSISLYDADGNAMLPQVDEELTTKKYVDQQIAGIDLSGKADVGHTHVAADITDFASAASAAAPVQSVAGKTGIVTLAKSDVGLGNVDNTSDLNKPISTATATALAGKQASLGTGTTSQYLRGDLTWQTISTSAPVAQMKYVAKHGVDATADGSQEKPYLTIAAAMAAITDATPSKRYVIKIAAGAYTEASVSLKANVFLVGESKESVRITGAVSMNADFNQASSQDCRSGLSMLTLLSAADFNWTTVTSPAGKLYFNEVQFGSTLNLYGYNNAIAQALFDSCTVFGAMTVSGINIGAYNNCNNFGDMTFNQHPNGGMATILNATAGYCGGTLKFKTTVSDFNRRCAGFLRGFLSENLIIDGPSSYADCDIVSQGKSSTQRLNGGTLVAMNPRVNHDLETQMLKPLANNAHNLGDWGKQWMFNFGYVHGSSGTELYVISAMESYDPAGDSAGRPIYIQSDSYGLKPNVDGGDIELETAATSGSGVRGKVKVKARELDVTSAKITNLAAGSASTDAVNKGQLDAAIAAVPAGLSGKKEVKTLSAGDITNGYVDCAFLAAADTMLLMSGGVVHQEGESYTLSVVGGKTRITFIGDLIAPSPSKLLAGDKVYIQYMK